MAQPTCQTEGVEQVLINSMKPLGGLLVEPALFLAGITGFRCESQDIGKDWEMCLMNHTSSFHDPNLLLRSFYEAQNPIIIQKYYMSENRRRITIGSSMRPNHFSQSPYDCYALSYCLANSSNHFCITIRIHNESDCTSLEMFAKGMKDHYKSTELRVECLELNLHIPSALPHISGHVTQAMMVPHSIVLSNYAKCLYWLTNVDFLRELRSLTFIYDAEDLQFSTEFIKSLTSLETLNVMATQYALFSTISLQWLPALAFLTKLKVLKIKFP